MRGLLVTLSVLLLLPGWPVSAAEEGQYRSRVRVESSGGAAQGRALSIEELEQQIGGITDAYARSSAGRHLARHFVEQQQYDKAVEYYRSALAAEGLSEVANREMLRELAQVYLLKGDYAAAAAALEQALAFELAPMPGDYLLLAQARYRLGDYVAVVAALDAIPEAGLELNPEQTRQALALYYRAGAWEQCETLLLRLLELEPNHPDHWHQLAAVHLQRGKQREALDRLTLAREKGVSFREEDLLLLVDLQAANGNPFGAGELLQQALDAGEVTGSADNYRKLFELWFQARETERAAHSLARAATLSGDTELFLYLAQLQMEQEAWRDMYQTMQLACSSRLQDRFVSRANLMLGISQLKLGDRDGARRSFINATLIGGANVKAAQWLEYMGAEPATDKEKRRIVGLCYGSEDRRRALAALPEQAVQPQPGAEAEAGDPAGEKGGFQFKTVAPMQLFYSSHEQSLQELGPKLQSLTVRLNVALIKARGTADGPLHIISHPDEPGTVQLGLPSRGAPQARGQYRNRRAGGFYAAYLEQEGEPAKLIEAWQGLAQALQAAGYRLDGERRLVVLGPGAEQGTLKVELQLGVEGGA